jgi:hypothetical protein
MRPFATWLVVGGLAVLGLFAARDALRSAPAPASSPGSTTSLEKRPHPVPSVAKPPRIGHRARLAARLRSLGADGLLLVADERCRRYLLQLPSLRWTTPEGVPGHDCGFQATPVVDEQSGQKADQIDFATIEVSSEQWRYRFSGSAAAFKPDGTLTFVRDGRMFEWTARCPQGAKLVTFRGLRDVERCARPIPGSPRSVREIVWIGERDFAVLAGPEGVVSLLVVRNGRLRSLFHTVGASMSELAASPQGRYFSVQSGSVLVFDSRRPGKLNIPIGVERPRAVSWSSDDRFTALASENSVFVYASDSPTRAVALQLFAVNVEWR